MTSDYRNKRRESILKYFHDNNITFTNDGRHSFVTCKEDAYINIVKSVRDMGYLMCFNEAGTIVGIKNDRYFLKLDYRANNITSSSMLSACFFATLLNNQNGFRSFIKRIFINLFEKHIEITSEIETELEWVDERGDKSHIDAVVRFKCKDEEYRLFFEVKYCEEAYGKRKRYDTEKMPEEKRKELQQKYIDSSKKWYAFHSKKLNLAGYQDNCITVEDYENSMYSRRYQIIRNVSHACLESNDYCLFLLAKGNTEAVEDIQAGLQELSKQNEEIIKKRVGVLFFENLLDKENDVYLKYFQ